ncbi:MAG: hypothetical protein WC044_03085 [Crocinitomicaceae bacterium]
MKWFLISIVGLFISCAVCKEKKSNGNAANSEELSTEVLDTIVQGDFGRPISEDAMIGIEGIVRVNKNGCPVLIEMVEGDLFSIVYPVNLAVQFQVDGLKIGFTYTLNSAMLVDGCQADKIISVTDVKIK